MTGGMLKPRKETQLAIRWHAEDLVAIDGIAEREERSRSEIVRFFVRWGIQQYKDFGSLQALELTSLLKLVEKRKGATKVAIIEGADVHREAHIRLQLLTEAQIQNDQTGFTDSQQRPKKTRVR